ncbi:MAG TPA: serine hydrolase domain-containing protein [Ilumatobacter sp.]|nr:serine hydrolase domain-containing protein [Ilumatobacter sp.]
MILAALAVHLVAACGEPGYTAPPVPQFTGGTRAAAAAGLAGAAPAVGVDPTVAPTAAPTTLPVAIDPADVAADLAPGESLPDDAGWSVADMLTSDDAGAVLPNFSGWDAFDAALKRRLVPANWAAGVAVMVGGQLVHAAAYGERAPGEPVDTSDRFRVASISKTITAIVALQLVEDGLLSLDEPVGATIAAYVGVTPGDPDVGNLTLRRLLNHTSGFPKAEGTFFGGGANSCADAAAGAYGGSLPAAAGYLYSNMNYCSIGLLIEAVTGLPYERVVHERLLEPLGIRGMRLTSTYETGPDEVLHHPSRNRNFMEALGAAGAWNATPADLVTILNSIDPATPGWKALSPESMAAMQPPAVGGYGLGLIGYASGWGHTGTIQNTHAMLAAQPDGITWAVTVSGDYPSQTSNLAGIVAAALAEAFPREHSRSS